MERIGAHLHGLVHLLAQRWDASPQPVFAHDSKARRIYSNPAFDQLVGYPGSELVGRQPPHPYWEPGATARMLDAVHATIEGRLRGLGVRSVVGTFRSAAGRVFDVLMTGGEIRDAAGDEIATVIFVFEVASDAAGETFPFTQLGAALEEIRRQAAMAGAQAEPGVPSSRLAGWDALTVREREVAGAIGQGARIPTIARELGVSEHTVRNHLKAVFRKTGIRSQEELALELQRAATKRAS